VRSSNRDELTTKANFHWEMMSVDKCLSREAISQREEHIHHVWEK